MLYTRIDSPSQLRDEFYRMGRGDQFSYAAIDEIFNYLESFDENIELDVIAICCDFSEDNLVDVLKSYNLESFEDLTDNTLAVMTDDETVLYQVY